MKSRTKYTVWNSLAGLTGQILTLFFSFVARTYFIKYLGTNNLGYDALFSNVISVLSIADLGITTALTYALYSPLFERNYNKVAAITFFFKRIFICIGLFLLGVSLCVSPFVSYFVKLDVEVDKIFLQRIFLLYAINSFSSYFFVDMRTLLIADQNSYIVSIVDSVIKVCAKIIQIYVLIRYSEYILYLIIEVILGIFSNIFLKCIARKKYNLRKYYGSYNLTTKEKKGLFSNAIYISLNKLASTGINCTDNILISVLVGTGILGIYSNYNLIIGTGYALIDKLVIGVTASLGNLFVEKSKVKQEGIIYDLQFIDAFFSSIVFVFLLNFVSDIVRIWLGRDMLLDQWTVFVVCLNQYFFMARKTLEIIMQSKGNFKELVPVKIIEMVINLIISVILAAKYGLIGVFIGTTVSLLISFAISIKILIGDIFGFNLISYVKNQVIYFLINLICFMSIWRVSAIIVPERLTGICLKLCVSGIMFIFLNYLIYRKNQNFISCIMHIRASFHRH